MRTLLVVLDGLFLLWGAARFADILDRRKGGRMRVVRRILTAKDVDTATKESLLAAARKAEDLPLGEFRERLTAVVDTIPDTWKAEGLRWKIHRAFLEESVGDHSAPFPRADAARYLGAAFMALLLLFALLFRS